MEELMAVSNRAEVSRRRVLRPEPGRPLKKGLCRLLTSALLLFQVAVASVALAQGSEPAGLLRVVNLSPDSPAIDLVANGAVIAAGHSFKQTTTYLQSPAVDVTMTVVPAGESGPVLAEIAARVPPGFHKTVVLLGFIDAPLLTVFSDDVRGGKGIAADAFQLRTIMAVPDIDYEQFVVSTGTKGEDCSDKWFNSTFPKELWPSYGLGDQIDEGLEYRPGPGPKLAHVYCSGDQLLAALPDGQFEGAPFEYGKIYTQFLVGSMAGGDVSILRLVDWEPTD